MAPLLFVMAIATASSASDDAVRVERAPDTAGRLAEAEEEPEAAERDTDWSPITYYFSTWLDDDLEPEAKSAAFFIWILSAFLPLGSVWSPFLFDEGGDGLFADLVLSAIVHYGLIALAWPIMCVPVVGYFALVGLSLSTQYWLGPVATVNIYSRSLKRKKAGAAHPLKREGGDAPKDGAPRRGAPEEARAERDAPGLAFAY